MQMTAGHHIGFINRMLQISIQKIKQIFLFEKLFLMSCIYQHVHCSSVLISLILMFIILRAEIGVFGYKQLEIDRLQHYKIIVEEKEMALDNFKLIIPTVNGTVPGPTIRVRQFDILSLKVVNKLNRTLTIHCHGLLQRNTLGSDGVPYITNPPIPPNKSQIYKINIEDQSGTFVYHAHTHMDTIYVVGAIIIEDNPAIYANYPPEFFYNKNHEKLIVLQEHFHIPLSTFLHSILEDFHGLLLSDSLLVNGKSWGVWKEGNNGNAEGYDVITVKPNRIYRFRVINILGESAIQFKIENHTMKIIEADGILVTPLDVDRLDINGAQRYSVLINTSKYPIGNYLIESRELPGPGPRNGIAILHYEGAPDPTPLRKVNRPGVHKDPIVHDDWILADLHPDPRIHQPDVYKIPKKADRSILFNHWIVVKELANGKKVPVFQTNKMDPQPEPHNPTYLSQIRKGINITNEPFVQEFIKGQVIQMVFQNHVLPSKFCKQHPIHVHGHTFYIVGEGPDLYNEETAAAIIDENISKGKLRFRDVATQFCRQKVVNNTVHSPSGWMVIRFKADNPGLWFVHCHITAHALIGKRFVIWEHSRRNPKLLGE